MNDDDFIEEMVEIVFEYLAISVEQWESIKGDNEIRPDHEVQK